MYFPGEALCAKLGLSPIEVYREIESLRANGYRIESRVREGYRLVAVPDRLTQREIDPFLATHEIGREIHPFQIVDSTNQVARRLAEEGAFHGEVVIAEQQSKGRGRRGREWLSPPGKNVTLSVILRPTCDPDRAPELTFVAGVAVASALREGFNLPVDLKWPNDLVVAGRKLAGILTELVTRAGRVEAVILGLGLNVNMAPQDVPESIADSATSLEIELGQAIERPRLVGLLLGSLERWYLRWIEEGFQPVREMWQALSATLQRPVRVHLGDGQQGFDGVAEGIDEHGALLVRRGEGVLERVVAGEVEHLRPLEHAPPDL